MHAAQGSLITIAERRNISAKFMDTSLQIVGAPLSRDIGRAQHPSRSKSRSSTHSLCPSESFSTYSTPSASLAPLTPPDDRLYSPYSNKCAIYDDMQRLLMGDLSALESPVEQEAEIRRRGTLNRRRERQMSAKQYATARELQGLMQTPAFGSPVCEKAREILLAVGCDLPCTFHCDGTVSIVEYGPATGGSISLVSQLAAHYNRTDPNLSFNITHADADKQDLARTVEQMAAPFEAYTSEDWQRSQVPSLVDRIFAYTANRSYTQLVCPKNTLNVGFSLLDLHWSTQTPEDRVRRDDATAELGSFLRTRAAEFKSGGILLIAYPQRNTSTPKRTNSELSTSTSATGNKRDTWIHGPTKQIEGPRMLRGRSESSPAIPTLSKLETDTWQNMASVLTPCIRRLVVCQLVTSDIAAKMLALPLHVRTPQQTMHAINNASADWTLTWSCGLLNDGRYQDTVQEQVLHLPHPASKAFAAGQLSVQVYAEHVLNFARNIWEGHFIHVMRECGGIGRSAIETTLAMLWQAFREKVEDGALQQLSIDVCVFALRRNLRR